MRHVSSLLRWREWGGYKQGPLVAVAYLVVWQHPERTVAAAATTVALLGALCWSYLLNAVTDREEDEQAGKLKPFANVGPTARLAVTAGLPAGAGILAVTLGGPLPTWGIGLTLLSGWLYSSGPRLRDRPIGGTAVAAIGQRTFPLLALTGLEAVRNDLVRTFSRGMQQRLAIGRAMLPDPQVLLLDEPHTGLDQDACVMLDQTLSQVAGQGRTLLMASHDLARSAALASRVDILVKGQIIASTATAALPPDGLLTYYRQSLEAAQ